MRCHSSGSRRQEENGLREEQVAMVISVMTVPAWWEGRALWMLLGSRR